uniref:Uncharacterized protein n=1 Tax=Setaria viridis TaxID=4556 RepID=A0A4U6T1R7_SETVI|nr:hypothetical protein SEVIR_9G290450v2 [Setaria viridis]
MEEAGGCGAKLKRLAADGLLPRISCSFPMFGVRPSIWTGGFGGLKFPCSLAITEAASALGPEEEEEQ